MNVQAPAAPAQPAPKDATATLDAMTPAERQTWRETGAIPAAAETPASVQAAPVEDDAEPEPAPVTGATSSPATGAAPASKPLSKRQQQINDLERRAKQAEIERDELRAQIEGRAAPAPADSSVPAKPFDGIDLADPKPKVDQFVGKDDDPYMQLADGDAYLAATLAINDWKARKDARIAQAKTQHETIAKTVAARERGYVDRCETFAKDHPEFAQKTAAVRTSIHPQSPIAVWLMDSPVNAQVLDHFADHPEDFARIARAPSYEAAHAAFVRLETRFEATSTAAPASAGSAALPPETSAPEPPTVLTGRGTAPADPVAAAIRDKDAGRYLREANARELAAFKRA